MTGVAILAALVLVAFIHRFLSQADGAEPALLIAVAWLTACAVAASLGSARRRTGLLLTAAGLVIAWAAWDTLLSRVDLVYLAQHAGSHAVLAAWFGGSLVAARRGRGEPLITRLATRLHGPLPPAIHRYTGQVTAVWAAYFTLMTAASLALFAFGSLTAWSALANLVTMPLVIGIFIVEYAVRLRLHPDFEHVSILDGVRAFMK